MNDLISLVTPASSVLGKALAGPNAALAQAALGQAVLDDEEATVEELVTALKSGDTGLKQKIQSAEARYLRKAGDPAVLAELSNQDKANARSSLIELETKAANDRASARQRQQITNDRTNAYLAYIVTLGFLLTILLVARINISGPANATLQTLLGILGTGWASIMTFYFGSSVGSREKTALLGEANTPPKNMSVSSGDEGSA